MSHGNVKLSNLREHDEVFLNWNKSALWAYPSLLSQKWLAAHFEVHLLTTLNEESNAIYQPCCRAQNLKKNPKAHCQTNV